MMDTTTDTTTPHTVVDTISARQKYAQIAAQYPAYYKAWRSMCGNNDAESITPEWRGVIGLMRFIEDTSTLTNNPDTMDASLATKLKLKRKQPLYPYSAANCYWQIPSRYADVIRSTGKTATVTSVHTIEQLKTLPPEERDARMNVLFEIQFNGGELTAQQQAELDILAALLAGIEIPTFTPTPKCEDI